MRQTKNMTPACILTRQETGFIRVWRNCGSLPLVVSVYLYLYHSTEHFRPRRPHRRELKPGITDDIIKLLNEIAVPVEEGLFSGMGLYNKIILWANACAGGRQLYPNRPTHTCRQAGRLTVVCGVIAGFLHAFDFRILFFPTV